MAYFAMEPFGEHAANWRAGMIAAVTANVNRPKNRRAFTAEDFMPKEPEPKREPQTLGEMASFLKRTYKAAERQGLTKKKKRKK